MSVASEKKYFPPVTQAVYNRGIAIGVSDIKNDRMNFRFRDEIFEIPSIMAIPHSYFNGYWFEIHIDKLRELENELAKSHATK